MRHSSDTELTDLRAAAQAASAARSATHEWIVRRFGAHLQGEGGGPADADLRRFARLVRIEQALHRQLDDCAGALAVGVRG